MSVGDGALGTVAPELLLRNATALVFVGDLDALALEPDDEHHLTSVLRIRPGDVVVASDGAGRFRSCSPHRAVPSVLATTRRAGRTTSLVLEATGPIIECAPTRPALTVGFALAKGDRADWTVQKLTELGTDVIMPLLTDRTIVRLSRAESARRGERFRRIARGAAAQSRRVRLPEVLDPVPLSELSARLGADVVLLEPGCPPLPGDAEVVLVGPEGGWSPVELSRYPRHAGIAQTVLRAETAALSVAALLTARRHDRDWSTTPVR